MAREMYRSVHPTFTIICSCVGLVVRRCAGLQAQRSRVRFPVGAWKKEIYFLAAYQCFGGHFKPSVQSAKSLGSSCFL